MEAPLHTGINTAAQPLSDFKGEIKMKVLITGFDPFGGELVNPALEAVKQLPDTIAGAEVIKIEKPTVFRKT